MRGLPIAALLLVSCHSQPELEATKKAIAPAVASAAVPVLPAPSTAVLPPLPPPLLARRIGRGAGLDTPAPSWNAQCAIHRPCAATRVIPHCDAGAAATSWSELGARAARTGSTVAVLGRLVATGNSLQTAQWCPPGVCCHRVELPIVLAGPPNELELARLACRGDESRSCCDALADGRMVVATGRLEPGVGPMASDRPWQLQDVTLCEPTR